MKIGGCYGTRIDQVIYRSRPCGDFTREDWILLAAAALDQAGVSPRDFSDAYTHSRGHADRLLVELDEDPPYLNGANGELP